LGDKAASGVLSPNGRSAVERLGRDFRRVLAACFAAANTWRSSLPLRPPSALWADKQPPAILAVCLATASMPNTDRHFVAASNPKDYSAVFGRRRLVWAAVTYTLCV